MGYRGISALVSIGGCLPRVQPAIFFLLAVSDPEQGQHPITTTPATLSHSTEPLTSKLCHWWLGYGSYMIYSLLRLLRPSLSRSLPHSCLPSLPTIPHTFPGLSFTTLTVGTLTKNHDHKIGWNYTFYGLRLLRFNAVCVCIQRCSPLCSYPCDGWTQ